MQIVKWIDDYRSSFAVVVECNDRSYLVIDDSYHVLIYSSDREGVISEYPEICKIEGKTLSEVISDNRTFLSNLRIWSKIDRFEVAQKSETVIL
jgi:hypothetical protein|tara:strand:+ start:376 stop:657 length:282 start_codon:yes stop_codon:yes gene_type:complete